jgi:hypothetical protein
MELESGMWEMTKNLLSQPSVEYNVVVKLFDGEPYDGNAAALPLQIPVAVVDVTAWSTVVGSVGFYDQGAPSAGNQDIGAPRVSRA